MCSRPCLSPRKLPATMWRVANAMLETRPECQKQLQAVIVKLDPDRVEVYVGS